jgi:hypothetical protein
LPRRPAAETRLFLPSVVFYFYEKLGLKLKFRACALPLSLLQASKLASQSPAHKNGSPTAYAVGRWRDGLPTTS